MNPQEIASIVSAQRAYFDSGATLPVEFRIDALKRLRTAIRSNEARIAEAIRADLGKSAFESYMCESGLVLSEISCMLRHIRSYSRERRVRTPLAQFASRSYISPAPYGVTLIMSPWNYPLLLTLDPLVDAIAAGNTAVVKPSAYSPNTSALLAELIAECFPPEYVAVITGGRAENACLLEEKFDFIFFTGSASVGRLVLEKAAPKLTPVALELGGKSPCIVDASADLKLAARRIVFGKYLNCGQTCVAPDYILCDAKVKDQLIALLKAEIRRQYGDDWFTNANYGKIINEKHFDRICGLIDPDKLACGGGSDRASLKIEPTVLDNVRFDDPVMQQEIFGPVLPVLSFTDLEQAIRSINDRPKPLALYLFTQSRETERRVLESCSFGGGCINDTIIHLATTQMGFGGAGESGMGSYHGKKSFEAFSHERSVVRKHVHPDLPMRYRPYTPGTDRVIRRVLG